VSDRLAGERSAGDRLADGRDELLPGLRTRLFARSPLGRPRLFMWLIFIGIPLVSAISSHDTGTAKALTIVAAAAFVAVFVWVVRVEDKPLPDERAFAAVAFLLAIAVALALNDRESWATLFIYTVACTAMCVRQPFAFRLVLLCTALCAGSLLARGSAVGAVISYATSTAGIGMLMLVLADLRERNKELHLARAELARMAVADERARFARTSTTSSATACR
jgi:two-component system, NarL family, sensor histidine kinase DesK